MPSVETITYQGVFNEHLFSVGPPEGERILVAECFPVAHRGEHWLAVFLKSVFDGKPRGATPIDLSVVIDISGSMSGTMERVNDNSATDLSRLAHAKQGVEWLVKEVLRDDDGIAVSS